MKKIFMLILASFLIGNNFCFSQVAYVEEISSITNNSTVFGIGIKDHYLYVNPGSSNIRVYDISNPNSPYVVNQIDYQGEFATDLDVFGDYLYIYGGPEQRLKIFDISNPILPIELGTLEMTGTVLHASHLENYSYLSMGDEICVVNTSDKTSPFVENVITYSSSNNYGLRNIIATTEYLYCGIQNGLVIYDNANLNLPVYHSVWASGSYNMAIDSETNKLYSSIGFTHYISDINSPFNPELLFQFDVSTSYGRLLINNGVLLQAGIDSGSEPYVQSVSFYKVLDNSTVFVEDFLGTVEYSITDIDAVGSTFFIAKNGGIEILEYHDGSVTNIKQPKFNTDIEVYPNPIKDNFVIKGIGQQINYQIIDIKGQVLQVGTYTGSRIDMTEFSAGTYILKVISDTDIKTLKLLKTH